MGICLRLLRWETSETLITQASVIGSVPREPANAAPGGRHGRSGAACAARGRRSFPTIRALPSGENQRPDGINRGAPQVHHVVYPLLDAHLVFWLLGHVGRSLLL